MDPLATPPDRVGGKVALWARSAEEVELPGQVPHGASGENSTGSGTARIIPGHGAPEDLADPTASARAPPTRLPIGIVSHTTNRMVAFIRPSSGRGHIPWRKLTWVML